MIVHRYLQIDSGQIEFLNTVHEYEDILAPLTLEYPVHDGLSLSFQEPLAKEIVPALKVGLVHLSVVMVVEDMPLKRYLVVEILVTYLARVDISLFDLDELATFPPAVSHVLLGLSKGLESLIAARALLVALCIEHWIFLALPSQHSLDFLVLV